MPTLFERIISGELPSKIVYRDDRVTAFRDINPRASTHILIVPNKPIPTVNEVAARDIAKQEGVAESGYRLIVNCGPDSGMEVWHLHMHLIGGRPLGPMVSG